MKRPAKKAPRRPVKRLARKPAKKAAKKKAAKRRPAKAPQRPAKKRPVAPRKPRKPQSPKRPAKKKAAKKRPAKKPTVISRAVPKRRPASKKKVAKKRPAKKPPAKAPRRPVKASGKKLARKVAKKPAIKKRPARLAAAPVKKRPAKKAPPRGLKRTTPHFKPVRPAKKKAAKKKAAKKVRRLHVVPVEPMRRLPRLIKKHPAKKKLAKKKAAKKRPAKKVAKKVAKKRPAKKVAKKRPAKKRPAKKAAKKRPSKKPPRGLKPVDRHPLKISLGARTYDPTSKSPVHQKDRAIATHYHNIENFGLSQVHLDDIVERVTASTTAKPHELIIRLKAPGGNRAALQDAMNVLKEGLEMAGLGSRFRTFKNSDGSLDGELRVDTTGRDFHDAVLTLGDIQHLFPRSL